MKSDWRLKRFPISGGISVSSFPPKYKSVMFMSCPISDGISPDSGG